MNARAHSWIQSSAWGLYNPVIPKYIRAMVFGVSLLWLMASNAIAYQFAYPDLGCDLYWTEADCGVMTSPYDPTQPACFWDPTVETPCAFLEPSSSYSPERMIIIIILMLAIDPVATLVEFIFMDVFNAPRKPSRRAVALTRAQKKFIWQARAEERELKEQRSLDVSFVLPALGEVPSPNSAGFRQAWDMNDPDSNKSGGVELGGREPSSASSAASEAADNDDDFDGIAAAGMPRQASAATHGNAKKKTAKHGHVRRGHRGAAKLRKLMSGSANDASGDDDELAPEVEETAIALPDPSDKPAFDAFVDGVAARECLRVVERLEELNDALKQLEASACASDEHFVPFRFVCYTPRPCLVDTIIARHRDGKIADRTLAMKCRA